MSGVPTGVRRVATVTGALLLAAGLDAGLTSCDSTVAAKNGTSGIDGQVFQIAPADRSAPISYDGTDLAGKPLDLAADRGQVTVVNTWWSGCGPCYTEMPTLNSLSRKLAGTVHFVGINVRDNSADGQAFERGLGVTYPSFYSADGSALAAFDNEVSPRTIPSTAVLDAQGRVAATITGPIPSALTLTEVIEQIQSGR